MKATHSQYRQLKTNHPFPLQRTLYPETTEFCFPSQLRLGFVFLAQLNNLLSERPVLQVPANSSLPFSGSGYWIYFRGQGFKEILSWECGGL